MHAFEDRESGDSIVWGQGFSESDRFDVLVRDALAEANPSSTRFCRIGPPDRLCRGMATAQTIVSPNPTDKNKSNRQRPPLMVAPPPGSARALEGSVNLRLTIHESLGATAGQIPFYFQPTLGGGDINGDLSLSSFQDYRFRAPNTILFRAAIEHSVYNRWPIGVTAGMDAGKGALTRGDIDFSDLRRRYSAGSTLRAGGFPMVYLLFSWGGGEGMHTNGRADASLLGGASRPSYD